MITPAIMLVLMIAPYVVMRVLSSVTQRQYDFQRAAVLGLAVLFVFTGVGHFAQTEPMSQMLPAWVPWRVPLVYATGILEFVIAIGFMVRSTNRLAGWVAAAVLILFFPANIYAAINHIPMGGHEWGAVYLLIRAPLQLVILIWVYWFTLRRPGPALRASTTA